MSKMSRQEVHQWRTELFSKPLEEQIAIWEGFLAARQYRFKPIHKLIFRWMIKMIRTRIGLRDRHAA